MASENASFILLEHGPRILFSNFDFARRGKGTEPSPAGVISILVLAYTTILIAFGVVGNMITLIMLKRNIFSPGVSVLFRYLVLMDSNILLTVVSRIWLNGVFYFHQHRITNLICKFHFYYSQICFISANWNIVAITIVRYIYIKYPMKAAHLCSEARAVLTVIINISCSTIILLLVGLIFDKKDHTVTIEDSHLFRSTGPLECISRPLEFEGPHAYIFLSLRLMLLCILPAINLVGWNTCILVEYKKAKDRERSIKTMATSSMVVHAYKKRLSQKGDSDLGLNEDGWLGESNNETSVDLGHDRPKTLPLANQNEAIVWEKLIRMSNISTPTSSDDLQPYGIWPSDKGISKLPENNRSNNSVSVPMRATGSFHSTLVDKFSTGAPDSHDDKDFSAQLAGSATSATSSESNVSLETGYREKGDILLQEKYVHPKRFELFYIIMISNISFITFHMPYTLWNIGFMLWPLNEQAEEVIYLISLMLLFSGHAVNFLIYGYSGTKFREELRNIGQWFRKRCRWL